MEIDVIVIGAGPAGAAFSTILSQNGFSVTVLEKSIFPRFSIGESLLPQSMTFLKEADLLSEIPNDLFQPKKGALFAQGDNCAKIDFSQKFTEGPSQTWQVERSIFDELLINKAIKSGVKVKFNTSLEQINFEEETVEVSIAKNGKTERLSASFIVDASGGAMVLPRLMKTVSKPSNSKVALFQHFSDEERTLQESENILISIHPNDNKIWYWGIPFKDNKVSVGVVTDEKTLESYSGSEDKIFQTLYSQEPHLQKRLRNASGINSVQKIKAYEAKINQIHGEQFLMIGNAAGFIDPIFSSGITIALKSAVCAAPEVMKVLRKEKPDWQSYDEEMALGNNTFKAYVDAWYDSSLQKIILSQNKEPDIQSKINSILAGYVWDKSNSFVREPARKLQQVSKLLERLEAP